ncbi:hypothetical protein [Streptomyces sp. NPDC056600]|uniref:hypothetical protein n=1 Tax=Streptomyces sp. NPDC056600 TaxID=3345874 RepID=UPI0036A72908
MKDDALPAGGPDDGRDHDPHDRTAPHGGAAPHGDTAAGPVHGPHGDTAPGPVHGPQGDTAPGPRHDPPRRRLAVAAVAAAVLAVAGVGTYAASSTGGPAAASPADPPKPEPLVLDGYGAVPQGLTFRAAGELPDGPDTAPVYLPEGQVPRERVAALAEALGLESTPRQEGTVWKAGEELTVDRKAPASWTFHRDPSGAKTPVDEGKAEKAAAPVLEAAGQGDARVDAGGTLGAERTVDADPVVGGLPTHGWTTALRVGPDSRVTSGAGMLADPVRGDSYPLVDAEAALKDLDRLSSGIGRAPEPGCATAVPAEPGGDKGEEAPAGRPSAVPPAHPCTPEAPLKRRTATVESAEFGLAAHFVDGRQTLVPSWMFEVRLPDGGDLLRLSHPAVDPAYLTTGEEPPAERPSPRPTGPDDGTAAGQARITGYRAEDGRLTVAFEAGVCSDFTVRTEEKEGRVEVTVLDRPWPERVCIMIAKTHHRTVELERPLGDRAVVDSEGHPVPREKDPHPTAR